MGDKFIRIKYLSNVYKKAPIRLVPNGDWIDLRAAQTIELSGGEYAEIPLGICVQLPHGFEAIIAPRSSLYKNYSLIVPNSIGIIDESYCGNNDEWHLPVVCLGAHTVINKGDRICQFRILRHQPATKIVTVDKLESCDRGGLGSTGR